jgi:hypothetical protein
MTYMAPYEGDIAKVDVTKLKFFKIAELGLADDGVTWATNVLTANDNVTAVTIPHDIKSGNYIVRHELITLHFATEDSRYMDAAAKTKGAQVSFHSLCQRTRAIHTNVTSISSPASTSPSPVQATPLPRA